MDAAEPADAELVVVEEFAIRNEFAGVRIRKVRSRVGERLEIYSARYGRTIRLDATTLEAISWQSVETMSQFIEVIPGSDPGDTTALDEGPA